MLNDFDDVNRILDELSADGIIEPMAEPCDEEGVHPLDWADAVGLWDEIGDILYSEA
jgi:hypothetical protein